MTNESELIKQSKEGNEEAFGQLVEAALVKIRPAIFNAYNSLNVEDFKDALQVAATKAWQKLVNFRGDSAFSTWFFIIVKNEVLNVLNVRNGIRKHELSTEDIAKARDVENISDYDYIYPKESISGECVVETAQTILEKQDEVRQYREMLNAVLDKLKPSHCQIIKLIFEEGKSYKEVSHELNIPIGTVMSRLFFARKNAQKLIAQYAQRNDIQLPSLGKP